MRVRTAIKIVFVLVVALAVAGAAILFNLDPNDHKGRIADYIKRETGRTLTIGAPIEFAWGRTTRLALRDVSFSNPDWAQTPDMVRVSEIDIRFALLPLLQGRLDVDSLVVRGARIDIETDKSGRSSLDFGTTDASDEDSDRTGNLDIDLEIAELEIEDVDVTIRDRIAGNETVATVERVKALPAGPGAPLDIDIAADIRIADKQARIDLDGQIGSWEDIIRGDREVPFDLAGEALGLDVEIDGSVRGPGNPDGFDVDVLVSGDALAEIQPFLETPLPVLGPMHLSANISGDQRAPIVNLVSLDAANIRVSGTTRLALSDDISDLQFDLKAEFKGQELTPIEPLARIPLAQFGPVNGIVNIRGDLDAMRFEPNRVAVANSLVLGMVTVGPVLDDPNVTYDLIVTANNQSIDIVNPIAGVTLPDAGPISGEIRAIGDLDKVRAETTGLTTGGLRASGHVDVTDLEADEPGVELDLDVTATDQPLAPLQEMLGDDFAGLGSVGGAVAIVGTLPEIRLSLRDFAIDRLRASGEVVLDVDADQPLKSYRVDIAGNEQRLGLFQPLLGISWPELGPVDLSASLEGDLETVRVDAFTFRSAITDLAGQGRITFDPNALEIEATATSEVTDLTRLFPDYEPARRPAIVSPEEAKADVPPERREKIFSDDPLPLDFLRSADLDISFRPRRLISPYGVFEDVNLRLVLEEDALAVRPLEARYAGSALRGDISLDARAETPLVTVSLRAPNLEIGQLLKDFADLDVLEGTGAVDIALSGSGNSAAAIAASLDGHARQLMGQGRMRNEGLGYVSGLFSGIGEALGGKDWVTVDCMANDFQFAKGVATSRVNLLSTEVITVTAEGDIDLGTETFKMKIKPRPRGFDLSLAVPVLVRGPLDDPSFLPDPLGTLAKIGSLLGSIVFPPAALIGLVDLGGNNHPCVQYAKTTEGQSAPTPSAPLENRPAGPGVNRGPTGNTD
jgi:uncharacterized protein involved in outer membrane biogenesis